MDPFKKLSELQPAKKAFSLLDEFKNFAFKGNVIDLAIGVIIGTAFSGLINSLVQNIFMPLLSLALPSEKGYTEWALTVGDKKVPYGKFLGDVVNFLLVTLVLFLFIVKFLGWVLQTRKEEAATPAPPTPDQLLLTEIRDLLKKSLPESPKPTEPTPHPTPP
jgi:large conductance mechanosensitive channel